MSARKPPTLIPHKDVFMELLEAAPFEDFFASYLSDDFRGDIHAFIDRVNSEHNECRAVFWLSEDECRRKTRDTTPNVAFNIFQNEYPALRDLQPTSIRSMRTSPL